ncbi:hypothetical protein TL16_g12641 [Triparma laevis f. inornata]|uniref:WW domain-containing protein n=1 Tax=Triparma laevis f. inornata TaxID=1714386 RepID=A0A9W7EWV9_9STRA|nr:hypothetical protein TL16_g12641 [Triparma laevis f. inornata]
MQAAAKKRRQDKRNIVNSVELVTLELKKEFGSPEVEDVKMNKNYPGFFSCDPFEVRFACESLNINTNAIKDRRYAWIARMCVLGGLPEGWVRGEDREIKGKKCRQFRDSEWENQELYITETPAYKYWKNVLKYSRDDDAAEDTGGRIEVVFDWNMFVKPKTRRSYTFNFIEGIFTFDDGGGDDVVEEEVEVEEVEEEEEEQESVLEALLLAQVLLNPVYTMKDILTFAKECKIPAAEVEENEKLSSFLKNELMKALPDTWERCVNPDGKIHYYDEPRKIAMWKHPHADGIRIRHEKVVAKRKKMLLEARIKERQDDAIKKAVQKTGQHVKNARQIDLNREKTEQSKMHFSHLDPDEEAIVYYRSRFGKSGSEFLVDSISYILGMMQEEAKEVECTPAQVVQMAIYFGIKPSVEPHLLCIAMCAVLAPLPPFWYVLLEEKNEIDEGGENDKKGEGRRESVKSIDFAIEDNGSAHFVTKEEELSPLVFARDVDESTTHKQVDHPSDNFWRQIMEESREAAKQLSDMQRLRCSILPFFNVDVESGNRLYYYDFKNGKPIFANSKGNFISSNIAHFKNLTLPKSVGGEIGFYEKKMRKKCVKRGGGIHKYQPKRELKVMKLNVSSPSFLPPIPRGHLEGVVEEEGGMDEIAAAERFLLSEMERLGEGGGFSGMQRPLAVANVGTIEGRGGTPWMDRVEGDVRNDTELDFMLAGNFKYDSSMVEEWGGGGEGEEYVWPEEL